MYIYMYISLYISHIDIKSYSSVQFKYVQFIVRQLHTNKTAKICVVSMTLCPQSFQLTKVSNYV